MTVEGAYRQDAQAALVIDLDVAGGGNDRLIITGEAVLGGRLRVNQIGPFDPAHSDWTYRILAADGPLTGPFARIDGPVREITYGEHEIVITTTYLGDADLSVLPSHWTGPCLTSPEPVPEPASAALLALGMLALLRRRGG